MLDESPFEDIDLGEMLSPKTRKVKEGFLEAIRDRLRYIGINASIVPNNRCSSTAIEVVDLDHPFHTYRFYPSDFYWVAEEKAKDQHLRGTLSGVGYMDDPQAAGESILSFLLARHNRRQYLTPTPELREKAKRLANHLLKGRENE